LVFFSQLKLCVEILSRLGTSDLEVLLPLNTKTETHSFKGRIARQAFLNIFFSKAPYIPAYDLNRGKAVL